MAAAGEGPIELAKAVRMTTTFRVIADMHNITNSGRNAEAYSSEALHDAYQQSLKLVQAFMQLAGVSVGLECSYPNVSVAGWLKKCGTCGVADAVKTCSACKVAMYCCGECQKKG